LQGLPCDKIFRLAEKKREATIQNPHRKSYNPKPTQEKLQSKTHTGKATIQNPHRKSYNPKPT